MLGSRVVRPGHTRSAVRCRRPPAALVVDAAGEFHTVVLETEVSNRAEIVHFHDARLFVNISNTSMSPSRWPTARMNDCSSCFAGGLAGITTFISARDLPRMVVMPLRVIFSSLVASGPRRRRRIGQSEHVASDNFLIRGSRTTRPPARLRPRKAQERPPHLPASFHCASCLQYTVNGNKTPLQSFGCAPSNLQAPRRRPMVGAMFDAITAELTTATDKLAHLRRFL